MAGASSTRSSNGMPKVATPTAASGAPAALRPEQIPRRPDAVVEAGPRTALAQAVDDGGRELVASEVADRGRDLRAAEVDAEHDGGWVMRVLSCWGFGRVIPES